MRNILSLSFSLAFFPLPILEQTFPSLRASSNFSLASSSTPSTLAVLIKIYRYAFLPFAPCPYAYPLPPSSPLHLMRSRPSLLLSSSSLPSSSSFARTPHAAFGSVGDSQSHPFRANDSLVLSTRLRPSLPHISHILLLLLPSSFLVPSTLRLLTDVDSNRQHACRRAPMQARPRTLVRYVVWSSRHVPH
jgi:hypothetical protein